MSDELDSTRARALIQAENQKRAEACMADIQSALTRHKCALQFVEMRVNGQQTQAVFQAVPQEQ